MATIALVGTLDTKGREYAFLRERLRESGVDVLVIDAGINEPVGLEPDVSREEVARAAGADAAALAAAGDRGAAVTAMAAGAEAIVRELYAARRFDGILALGGSGGSSIAAPAMRALPVGVPKLLVSTVASGDTRPYVGAVDVTMMYSVVDISGVNTRLGAHHGQRRGCDRRHGQGDRSRGGGEAARCGDDVRCHDPLRHDRARAARGAWL